MEKAIKRYWPVFVLPTLIAFIIGFVWPFLWGIFPSAYFVYTMIRARVSSFRFYNGSPYPYAFMDVDALGWGKVLLIFLGMAAAFLAFGYVLVWLDHLLARRRRA